MSRRKRKEKQAHGGSKAFIFLVILLVILGFLGFFYIQSALSVLQKDRVNILSYGKKTAVYSIGLKVDGNYIVPFYPDLKIDVPGGYGAYRVGALGKLVTLEKKPDILRKSFSDATSSFIDYYFYSSSQDVYFGGSSDQDTIYPNMADIIFHRSNASMGERLAIAYIFLKNPPQQFTLLKTVDTEKKDGRYFVADNFSQQYQGFFYRKAYRDEKKEVQILYTDMYESAKTVSQILQGNGIRVSDVSQADSKQDHCRIIENSKRFSQTSVAIASFLGCELSHGRTDIYDILVELSNKEREW